MITLFFKENYSLLINLFIYYFNYLIFYSILYYLIKNKLIVYIKNAYTNYLSEKNNKLSQIKNQEENIKKIEKNYNTEAENIEKYRKDLLLYAHWQLAKKQKCAEIEKQIYLKKETDQAEIVKIIKINKMLTYAKDTLLKELEHNFKEKNDIQFTHSILQNETKI